MRSHTDESASRPTPASGTPVSRFRLPMVSTTDRQAQIDRRAAAGSQPTVGNGYLMPMITEPPARRSPRRGWEPQRVLLGTGEGGGVGLARTPPPLSPRSTGAPAARRHSPGR